MKQLIIILFISALTRFSAVSQTILVKFDETGINQKGDLQISGYLGTAGCNNVNQFSSAIMNNINITSNNGIDVGEAQFERAYKTV